MFAMLFHYCSNHSSICVRYGDTGTADINFSKPRCFGLADWWVQLPAQGFRIVLYSNMPKMHHLMPYGRGMKRRRGEWQHRMA